MICGAPHTIYFMIKYLDQDLKIIIMTKDKSKEDKIALKRWYERLWLLKGQFVQASERYEEA